jgi:DNA-binding NtrC family response regulator
VYLPLAGHDVQSAAPSVAPPEGLDGTESILVVDDDGHVRRSLERILTRHGYHVQTEGTAERALAALGTQHFDLIVSDVALGAGDGVSLVAQARAADPALRAIFITGYSRTTLSGLAAPHLIKPFSAAELLRLLRRTLL